MDGIVGAAAVEAGGMLLLLAIGGAVTAGVGRSVGGATELGVGGGRDGSGGASFGADSVSSVVCDMVGDMVGEDDGADVNGPAVCPVPVSLGASVPSLLSGVGGSDVVVSESWVCVVLVMAASDPEDPPPNKSNKS